MNDYLKNLDPAVKKRYNEKIALINNVDPYLITDWDRNVSHLPPIKYIDIVNYLVYGISAYTMEEFRAYKSLESYNQFICGWVKDIKMKNIGDLTVILGKVMHSMRLTLKPLLPWIIVKSSEGNIESAHCNCMAGLGEVCSHVGALLFYIEDVVRNQSQQTVTDKLQYWGVPSLQNVCPSKVEDIDFSTPNKKLKLNSTFEEEATNKTTNIKSSQNVPSVSEAEFKEILNVLKKNNCDSPLGRLSGVIPKPSDTISNVITEMHRDKYIQLSLKELQEIAKKTTLKLSNTEVTRIEVATRNQHKCKEWHKQRTGRITASRFKAVCHTTIQKPSISLIKEICYPQKFKSKQTFYGCCHEKEAVIDYSNKNSKFHKGLRVQISGLVIHPDYPQFGASPDGLVTCECCHKGCLEIKCPFCWKEYPTEEFKKKATSFLDELAFDKSHKFYYQAQMQMFLTRTKYCDLALWNKNSLVIKRLFPDNEFFQEKLLDANKFFQKVILPEVLGKAFTRKTISRPSIIHLSCN